MALTLLPNVPVTTLQPVGPWSITPTFIACDPTNGNYFVASNNDLVTFYCHPSSDAAAWNAAVTYTQGQVVNFSLASSISNVAVTSNVLTIQSVNTLQAGDQVTLSGLTTATFLNGQTVTVLSSGLSSTQFSANYTHADYAAASDTGTASIPSAPWIAKAGLGNLNVHPTSTAGAALWQTYVANSSTINVTSAPDSCTQRTDDIVAYPIVDEGHVEFKVVPGSVFTQASGQVQFQASSNLVYVLVRSL